MPLIMAFWGGNRHITYTHTHAHANLFFYISNNIVLYNIMIQKKWIMDPIMVYNERLFINIQINLTQNPNM